MLAGLLFVTSGCARSRSMALESVPHNEGAAPARCWTCTTIPMDDDLAHAIDARIEALKERGGTCAEYGAVMESSVRSGRISMRPSMWRHGTRLVAGEASPSGEMSLAREIDSLNVGRRGIDEVIWTMEHEAVHIAFAIPSTTQEYETLVNSRVRSCQA
jgi:hypothetical protein